MELKVKWHCEYRTPCRLQRQYSNELFIGCQHPEADGEVRGHLAHPRKLDFSPWCLYCPAPWGLGKHTTPPPQHHNAQLAPLAPHPNNKARLPAPYKDDANVLWQ